MTLGELRAALRSRLDDTTRDYLWSDAELNAYLNQAVDEACLRAQLGLDSTTSVATSIAAQAGVSKYPLHASVIYVERVQDTSSGIVRIPVKSATHSTGKLPPKPGESCHPMRGWSER